MRRPVRTSIPDALDTSALRTHAPCLASLQIAKNVTLAGVGSVALLDDATCDKSDPGNFLVPDSAAPTAR